MREALARDPLSEAPNSMMPLLEDVRENPRIVMDSLTTRMLREEQLSVAALRRLVDQQEALHERLTRAGRKKRQLSERIRAERESGETKRAALGASDDDGAEVLQFVTPLLTDAIDAADPNYRKRELELIAASGSSGDAEWLMRRMSVALDDKWSTRMKTNLANVAQELNGKI